MTPTTGHQLEWNAERLYHQLSRCVPNLGVEVVAQIGSTNTALLERARVTQRPAGEVDLDALRRRPDGMSFGRRDADYQPALLVAEHQTHGRGRQGRSWQAEPGASLTFSLAMALGPTDWSGFSLAVGVALAEALDPTAGRDTAGAATGRPWIGIKWPNDLWLMPPRGEPGAGRKLGGLLIETVPAGALRLAVVGVGLNVQPMALDASQAASGFACLQELDSDASAPGALHRVALPLVEALLQFSRGGFAAFADRFARRDVLRGCTVQTGVAVHPDSAGEVAKAQSLTGVADGVAGHGALRVITPDGVHEVISGEVSVRVSSAGKESSC